MSVKRTFFGFMLLLLSFSFASCAGKIYDTELLANTGTDVFAFTISISNGEDQIVPLIFLTSSYEQISQDGDAFLVRNTDYIGMYGYDMVQNRERIPEIDQSNGILLTLSNSITNIDYLIYDSSAVRIADFDNWSDLGQLDKGQYFAILDVHNEIANYYANAQCLFVLNVY